MDEQWRRDLRAARHNAGLTLDRLARRCGLSYEAIRGYENGRRRPTRKSLRKLLDALALSAADAAVIIERAGFTPDQPVFAISGSPEYHYSLAELQPAVNRLAWPAFVLDESLHLIAVNRAAERLWGHRHAADRRKPPAERRTLWSVAAERGFASRIVNLEEVVRVAAARYKGGATRSLSFGRTPVSVDDVLDALGPAEPARRKKTERLYVRTKPAAPKVRWQYPLQWNEPRAGVMRFEVVVTPANEPAGYSFNEWIPVDAETWQRLARADRRG